MDIHDFWMSVFNYIHASVDIHIDIQAGISKQGHSAIDIRKQEIFMNEMSLFL